MIELCPECKARAMKGDPLAVRINNQLSVKERQVIAHLVNGASNHEIAVLMNTSTQVIKNRMTQIFNKVGCDTRLALAMFVVEHPMLMLSVQDALKEPVE